MPAHPPTPVSAPPHDLASLQAHLPGCHSLPLPAGPVVPGLWLMAATGLLPLPNADRARLAVLLVQAEMDALPRNRPVSKLAGLAGDAVADWFDQHPGSSLPYPDNTAPGRHQALMVAIGRCGTPGPDDGRLDAFQDFTARGGHRAGRAQGGLRRLGGAYAGQAYHCGCASGSDDDPAAHGANANPVDAVAHPAVTALLNRPDGAWVLLAGLFLKQLHMHWGWWPKVSFDDGHHQAFYQPVLLALHSIGRQAEGELCGTAAGLVLGLGRLSPSYCSGGQSHEPVDDVPDCFQPTLVPPEAKPVADARLYLAGHPGLLRQVAATGQLAQALAAALSDPFSAHCLGLRASHFLALGEHLAARHKLAHQADQADRLLAPQGRAFLDTALSARAARLRTYARWMHRRGLRLTAQVLGQAARPAGARLVAISRPNLSQGLADPASTPDVQA